MFLRRRSNLEKKRRKQIKKATVFFFPFLVGPKFSNRFVVGFLFDSQSGQTIISLNSRDLVDESTERNRKNERWCIKLGREFALMVAGLKVERPIVPFTAGYFYSRRVKAFLDSFLNTYKSTSSKKVDIENSTKMVELHKKEKKKISTKV